MALEINKTSKNQAFDYAKHKVSPLMEEGQGEASSNQSSNLSIPEENYDFRVEEIEVGEEETLYLNQSNLEKESAKQINPPKKNKITTNMNGNSRNQMSNNLTSRISPLRSYEAFADAKRIL